MLRFTPRTALLSSLAHCTCSRAPPALVRHYAAAPSPPPVDKLLLAARKTLDQAAANSESGSIEAAKRDRELDGLRAALADVTDGEEVSSLLLSRSPPTSLNSSLALQQLVATLQDLSDNESDPDLRELALGDLPEAESTLRSLRSTLRSALIPAPSVSALSALLEIKSGVGGSESSLFAAELVRMYTKMATRKGWKASLVESVGLGGVGMGTGDAYREAILEVTGEGAFGVLRREAGVHRVQRVPATESQGRVHTSTVGIIVS